MLLSCSPWSIWILNSTPFGKLNYWKEGSILRLLLKSGKGLEKFIQPQLTVQTLPMLLQRVPILNNSDWNLTYEQQPFVIPNSLLFYGALQTKLLIKNSHLFMEMSAPKIFWKDLKDLSFSMQNVLGTAIQLSTWRSV